MGNAYRLFALFVLMGILMGCGGGDSQPVVLPIEQHAQPDATAVSFDLMPPVDALELIANRTGAATRLQRNGSELETGLAQRVVIEDSGARFSPAWAGGSSNFDQVAYAIYSFDVYGHSGNQLQLEWDEAPQGNYKLWIGLSDWNANRWEWFAGTTNGPISLGGSGLADFFAAGTAEILVAVVLLGTDSALLDSLYFGEDAQGDWWMSGRDPQHTRRSPFVGAQTNELEWEFRTIGAGFGFTGAAVGADGTIYTGSGPELHALYPDGSVKWYSTPCWPSTPPALAPDGTIYIGGENNKLYAFDPDGGLEWTYPTAGATHYAPAVSADGTIYVPSYDSMTRTGTFSAINPDGILQWSYPVYIGSTPVIDTDGTIYFWHGYYLNARNPDGSKKWFTQVGYCYGGSPVIGLDGTVYVGTNWALRAIDSDGSMIWANADVSSVKSTPAICENGYVYVGSDDGNVYAVRPDGSVAWTYATGGLTESSTVVSVGGAIYVSSDNGFLYAFSETGLLNWKYYTGDKNSLISPAISPNGTVYQGSYRQGNYYSGHDSGKLYAVNAEGVAWTYTTGQDVESSPVIGNDGTLYFGSNDCNVYAINPDGTQKWTYTTGDDVSSTPALGSDGTLYVGSDDYKLYAINPDGSYRWAFATDGEIKSSPAIGADGTIYVGSNDNHVYAINPDGSLKWSYETDLAVISSPALGTDGTVYVGSWGLLAFDPDGSLKWSRSIYAANSSPAVGDDGTVYIGSDTSYLYAYDPDGELKWAVATASPVQSSPGLSADGTVYVGSDDGNVYAINPSGSLKWSYATEGKVKSSPAIGADGTIYVGSWDDKVYALKPDGTELWSFMTGDRVNSSPAIGADGTVYVGSDDGKLYAFGPTL